MSRISYESFNYDKAKPVCILGCLLTDAGKSIKTEMLTWLTPNFSVICINQDEPGDLFEFPALNCAKIHSLTYNIPVLYLHTKGAGHSYSAYGQDNVRLLWQYEFTNHFKWYFDKCTSDSFAVAAPFVSDAPFGITWMNGFIAGVSAWSVSTIQPPISNHPNSRLVYEQCFNGVCYHPYARIYSGVNKVDTPQWTRMMEYIKSRKYE